jgi:polyhydroxyalkanoate synthesis regulator phasin
MAFKMKGFSAFTKQTDPPSGQDTIKTKEDQIKDLLADIEKLLKRNNPDDEKRIRILREEVERLRNK